MKKISIILLAFFLVCIASGKKITSVDDKIDAFEEKTKSHLMRTKGNTYYVNSSVTTDNGNGTSWDEAVGTLAEAVALCADNHDDVIFIASGHTETITAATTINVDGLTIICLGTSGVDSGLASKTAQFDFTTSVDAAIRITGTPITWVGGDFMCDIANQKQMFYIYTGNNFYIKDAVFRENESTGLTFIQCSTTDSVETCVTIENCYFYAPTAGNYDSAISIPSDQIGWTIRNNRVFGDFDDACINIPVGGNAQVNLLITDNVLTNIQSGQYAIKINGTGSTGIIAKNIISTDSEATSIDAGGLAANGMGNTFALYATDATVTYGASVSTFTGYALDHLASAADGTGAYPASVVNDSILAMIMTKGATATTSTYDNTTDSQEMISDKLGGFSGDGGANQDDSTKASLDLAHTDLDAILADTALWDTTAEAQTILFGSATAGATATNLATAQADLDIITGATGVNLLTATQASIDAIETSVGLDLEGTLDAAKVDINTVDAIADDILTKALDINGDTNDIMLGLVGTYFSTTSIVESNDIPHNTQVAGAITGAASGTLLLTDIIVSTDATGFATPTNICFSTDNAFGNTGVALPIFVEVVASFGANLTVSKKDATSHTLPMIIESGKKVFIHGDSAAGTGAGYGKVTLVFQRLSAGAAITAVDLDTD